MVTNPPILLLDANVWIDTYIPGRAGYATAQRLISYAHASGASLAFPAQACLDVYQRSRSDSKRALRQQGPLTEAAAKAIKGHAWDCVNHMRQVATAIPVDATDVSLACKLRDSHDDFEDDLVLVSCSRARANYLVTNDRKLISRSHICAKTPEEMLALLVEGRAQGWPLNAEGKTVTDYLTAWLAETTGVTV